MPSFALLFTFLIALIVAARFLAFAILLLGIMFIAVIVFFSSALIMATGDYLKYLVTRIISELKRCHEK